MTSFSRIFGGKKHSLWGLGGFVLFTTEPAEQAEFFVFSVLSVVKVFRHRFIVLRHPPPLGARGLRLFPCIP